MTGVFNNEMDGSRARSGRTIEVQIHVRIYDLDTTSEKYITAEQWCYLDFSCRDVFHGRVAIARGK
jgi:hypothetical protein